MKGGTCLLFGDEHRSLVEMERLAKEHIGCRVAHGSRYYRAEGHHQQSFNMLPAQEKCRATKELITDLELMANADYFVGSSTSGVPGIVATLRLVMYKKSQITLADATYNDMGAKLRRYWGLGGFKNITVDTMSSGLSSSRRMRDSKCHSHDC
ncbi:g2760 [Coccomyxa elongata]